MNYLVGHGIRRTKMSKENKSKSKKALKTQFSYNPLWKMLIDRGLKKRELQEMSEVSATSIAKLGRNENVTTEVLLRICESLDCDIQDIMERIPIKHDETAKQEG
jgi:DNA-binding Xre family transcriptional regulator